LIAAFKFIVAVCRTIVPTAWLIRAKANAGFLSLFCKMICQLSYSITLVLKALTVSMFGNTLQKNLTSINYH